MLAKNWTGGVININLLRVRDEAKMHSYSIERKFDNGKIIFEIKLSSTRNRVESLMTFTTGNDTWNKQGTYLRKLTNTLYYDNLSFSEHFLSTLPTHDAPSTHTAHPDSQFGMSEPKCFDTKVT
jgi:hypothetical protein